MIADIEEWLEKLAPYQPDFRHHATGESNGDAYLKSLMAHYEVICPSPTASWTWGPWQQVDYAEFDGRHPKRVIVKALDE